MSDTILTTTKISHVDAAELFSCNSEAVRAVATWFVAQHVEAHAEMLRDDEDKPTYQDAAARMQDARWTVEDYIKDLFTELELAVLQQVKETTITIKSMTFTEEGFESVNAVVG